MWNVERPSMNCRLEQGDALAGRMKASEDKWPVRGGNVEVTFGGCGPESGKPVPLPDS